MKRLIILILSMISVSFSLSGCRSKSEEELASFTKITGAQAKKMMEEDDSLIILDVRTEEEFKEGHIEGAILIPNNELKERANEELPDKDSTILVYCRSGARSAMSAQELADAGYTNVYDFGGIIDWEYETVKE